MVHAIVRFQHLLSSSLVIFLAVWIIFFGLGFAIAKKAECPVGVNVNSFQNFSAQEQESIVQQLKDSKVRFVRTSLRPDEKNINLAKRLQDEGIGLVVVPGVEYAPGTPQRPANEANHLRAAMPLSAAVPERSRTYYQSLFDKLDAKGVQLTGVELGNKLNWADFNGDVPASVQAAFCADAKKPNIIVIMGDDIVGSVTIMERLAEQNAN